MWSHVCRCNEPTAFDVMADLVNPVVYNRKVRPGVETGKIINSTYIRIQITTESPKDDNNNYLSGACLKLNFLQVFMVF